LIAIGALHCVHRHRSVFGSGLGPRLRVRARP
jgi:hypothetical protein